MRMGPSNDNNGVPSSRSTLTKHHLENKTSDNIGDKSTTNVHTQVAESQGAHAVHESLLAFAEDSDSSDSAGEAASGQSRDLAQNDQKSRDNYPVSPSRARRRVTNRASSKRVRERNQAQAAAVRKLFLDLDCSNTKLKYEILQLQKEKTRLSHSLENHQCRLPVSEGEVKGSAVITTSGVWSYTTDLPPTTDSKRENVVRKRPFNNQTDNAMTYLPGGRLTRSPSEPEVEMPLSQALTDISEFAQQNSNKETLAPIRPTSLPVYSDSVRRPCTSYDEMLFPTGNESVPTGGDTCPGYKGSVTSPSLTPVCDALEKTTLVSPNFDPAFRQTTFNPTTNLQLETNNLQLSNQSSCGWNSPPGFSDKNEAPNDVINSCLSALQDNLASSIYQGAYSYWPTANQQPESPSDGSSFVKHGNKLGPCSTELSVTMENVSGFENPVSSADPMDHVTPVTSVISMTSAHFQTTSSVLTPVISAPVLSSIPHLTSLDSLTPSTPANQENSLDPSANKTPHNRLPPITSMYPLTHVCQMSPVTSMHPLPSLPPESLITSMDTSASKTSLTQDSALGHVTPVSHVTAVGSPSFPVDAMCYYDHLTSMTCETLTTPVQLDPIIPAQASDQGTVSPLEHGRELPNLPVFTEDKDSETPCQVEVDPDLSDLLDIIKTLSN